MPIVIRIVCSGICVPILEELVFRGILYNKLKEYGAKTNKIIAIEYDEENTEFAQLNDNSEEKVS